MIKKILLLLSVATLTSAYNDPEPVFLEAEAADILIQCTQNDCENVCQLNIYPGDGYILANISILMVNPITLEGNVITINR